MKVKLKRLPGRHPVYTTVGYWSWDKPDNKGTLTIEVSKMKDWRHELAVWGHEIIEVFYCWLFGVTTEEADKFDSFYEAEYAAGRISPEDEAGDDRRCPYHWGHMGGVVWEHIVIRVTFASMVRYAEECNAIMGI